MTAERPTNDPSFERSTAVLTTPLAVLCGLGIALTCGTAYALSLGCGPTASHGTTAASYAGPVQIVLVNDIGLAICTVQMTPSSDSNWGDNWLMAGDVIPAGSERVIMSRGDSAWDVQVWACGAGAATRTGMRIPVAGPTRVSLATMTSTPVVSAPPPTSGGARPPATGSTTGRGGSLY